MDKPGSSLHCSSVISWSYWGTEVILSFFLNNFFLLVLPDKSFPLVLSRQTVFECRSWATCMKLPLAEAPSHPEMSYHSVKRSADFPCRACGMRSNRRISFCNAEGEVLAWCWCYAVIWHAGHKTRGWRGTEPSNLKSQPKKKYEVKIWA